MHRININTWLWYLSVFVYIYFINIKLVETKEIPTKEEIPRNISNIVKTQDVLLLNQERSRKDKNGLMEKILPFMVIPFMISSMMIPMALIGLKLMLLKSAFIGKVGIILLLISLFTRFNNRGGVYSHNINLSPAEKEISMAHYGYNGDEEYGAYINRRKRRR